MLKFQRKTKQSFRICHEKIIKPLFLYTKLLEFDLVISSTHSNYGTGNKAGYWCFGHHLHWLAPPMRSVATAISKYFLNFSSRKHGRCRNELQTQPNTLTNTVWSICGAPEPPDTRPSTRKLDFAVLAFLCLSWHHAEPNLE